MQPLSVLSSIASRGVALIAHPLQAAGAIAGETLGLGARGALRAWETVATVGSVVGSTTRREGKTS